VCCFHAAAPQVALKCADLGHLAEARDVHARWVACLEEEFFRQGDREKASGLPVSPLFDRDKPGITKSQVGFFDFVALPLFHAYTHVFPRARPLWDAVVGNYGYWKAQEARD
jgi:cAMP-specific phosphodiesterase 4